MPRPSGRTAMLAALVAAACASPARAQCPDGTPPPCGLGARVTPVATSIAVLYFENLSRDSTDAYLADGLTEELTARLGDVERLRVSGRSAVRRAQQTASGDLAQLGRALGVRYLVEGSVRRSGPSVRVTARLLRASDGVRVWGDSYDRTMTDILALQEEIAQEIVTNVAGQLLPGERAALASRPTADAVAYDHYLRGSVAFNRRSSAGFRQAIDEFERALRRDPRFAAAEARRAYVLVTAFAYGVEWASPESLQARATRSADRAIRLDSTSADAWVAKAVAAAWFDRDLRNSRALVERAVALEPRSANAQHALGTTLAWLAEDSAAAAAYRRALSIDPGRAVSLLDLAELYTIAHRFDAALELLDSAVALDPEQARPRAERAGLRLAAGNLAGARSDVEIGLAHAPGYIRAQLLSWLVAIDAAAGDSAAARRQLAVLDSLGPSENLARALVSLGEPDRAVSALEATRPAIVSWRVLRFPEFDALRALPRFQHLFEAWRPAGARRP